MKEIITTKEGWSVYKDDTHLSRWVEEKGVLDTEGFCNGVLVPLLKPGWHVIDGGASLGDHTIAYSRAVGEGGIVHAFELFPPAIECLKRNMKHGKCNNVIIHEHGLSNKEEVVHMAIDKNVGASHIHKTIKDVESMRCRPLDDLNLPRLDYMKLDVEGYEYFALQGGIRTILRFRPIICLEFNKVRLEENGITYNHIYNLMGLIGYTPRPHDGEVYEGGYDQVFFPDEHGDQATSTS